LDGDGAPAEHLTSWSDEGIDRRADGVRSGGLLAVVDGNVATGVRKGESDGFSDAARRASDECNAIAEKRHVEILIHEEHQADIVRRKKRNEPGAQNEASLTFAEEHAEQN